MVSISYPSVEAGVSVRYSLPNTGYIAPTEDQAARLMRLVDAACPWLGLAASTNLAEFRRAFNATGLMFRRSEPDTKHSFSHFLDAANDMLGDVVEEADGDLMGDGVNIAARLEGVAKPGAICLSEDAYRQVKQRLDLKITDLGATQLKNKVASRVSHVVSRRPTRCRPAWVSH